MRELTTIKITPELAQQILESAQVDHVEIWTPGEGLTLVGYTMGCDYIFTSWEVYHCSKQALETEYDEANALLMLCNMQAIQINF